VHENLAARLPGCCCLLDSTIIIIKMFLLYLFTTYRILYRCYRMDGVMNCVVVCCVEVQNRSVQVGNGHYDVTPRLSDSLALLIAGRE